MGGAICGERVLPYVSAGTASSKLVLYSASSGVDVPVLNLTISQNTIAHGEVTSVGTDLGWTVQTETNTACTSTCANRDAGAAVHGWNGITPVNKTDALADTCLCAGG